MQIPVPPTRFRTATSSRAGNCTDSVFPSPLLIEPEEMWGWLRTRLQVLRGSDLAIMKSFGGVLFLFRQSQRGGNTAELSGFALSFKKPGELTCQKTGNYPGKTIWHAGCQGARDPKPQHSGMAPVLYQKTDGVHRSTERETGCFAHHKKGHIMLPVIGLLGTAFAALGAYVLVWYHDLTKEEREEADRLACDYAMQIYNRKLNQLSHSEKGFINDLVKQHF